MKKLFLLLFFAICAIGWFYGSALKNLSLEQTAAVSKPAPFPHSLPKSNFILPDSVPDANKQPDCISLSDYVQQAHSEPKAYYKLLHCNQTEQERTEFDKLMNFFARLKYE